MSLRPKAYLSHGTAAYLHALLQDVPATFYVNKEQAPKPQAGRLTQEGLDRAFAARPRQSNLVYSDERRPALRRHRREAHREARGRAGAWPGRRAPRRDQARADARGHRRATRLRGGSAQGARGLPRRAGARLRQPADGHLKKLGHLYPYHQAIGFYLERAGYDERALDLARRPGLEFDFYLTHGMKDTEFSRDWRLWYPRGL